MIHELQITVSPEFAHNEQHLRSLIAQQLSLSTKAFDFTVDKRSIDARKKPVKFVLKVTVYEGEEKPIVSYTIPNYANVSNATPVIIVGAGPAGLFAAIKCLEKGLKPIVLERGKNVRDRRRDLAKIHKEHSVNPESNYCFGEGGAGTYSDGKLYTRSTKRGDVNEVLHILVQHGASSDILVDAHPHIGTNKLPQIIQSIRETIIAHGGEVHFNTKVTDFIVEDNAIKGVVANNKELIANFVVLATGHSARDIFYLLNDKNIAIEFKPFALGVRIEHPQALIDELQYKVNPRGEFLPPAAYSLVTQAHGRGVYSFCMCPGGIVAPCATEQEEVVTNGWSPSKRNNPYSNSGIVTEVRITDIPQFEKYGALAGLEFQKSVEHACWQAAGKTQKVPAQRMIDFIQNKPSTSLPETSYQPGLTPVNLNEVLPDFIAKALRKGLQDFGNKMRGYLTNDAVLHAPESRTSSPVRIPRDKETLQHVTIKGLYPCGEGAGYAGGIVSAAIDGMKVVSLVSSS
jgi:uncharacterized FAD-dependent dehydrogenase